MQTEEEENNTGEEEDNTAETESDYVGTDTGIYDRGEKKEIVNIHHTRYNIIRLLLEYYKTDDIDSKIKGLPNAQQIVKEAEHFERYILK